MHIVIPDHYATLGVPPTSHDAVIRAAYVALMRRYHPDRNPSAAAAARVRAITVAYAVLRVPRQRANYDFERNRALVLAASAVAPARRELRLRRWLPASLFGAAAVLLLLPLLIPPPFVPPDQSGPASSVGGRQQAAPLEQDQTTTGWNPDALCSSAAAASQIKRELFRRAARLRGSDRAAYDTVADYTLIRFTSPLNARAESETVSCNASIAVDLPPGVATLGGQRTLAADVAYSLRTAAGAMDMVSLSNEGRIVAALAGLAQMPRQATGQVDPLAAPEHRARYEQADVVEQMSSAAQPPNAAVAPAQTIQPRWEPPQPRPAAPPGRTGAAAGAGETPAWQRPIRPPWQEPLKPAWQRPLPTTND